MEIYMNKTITLYELIGLMKDNKAPKLIRISGDIWCLFRRHDEEIYYVKKENKDFSLSFNYYIEHNKLNEKTVEIIEENDEWEDIEEINFLDGFNDSYYDTCLIKMGDICNQLIKNQKYLKGRLIEKNEK